MREPETYDEWVLAELETCSECPCCWVDLTKTEHSDWCPAGHINLESTTNTEEAGE